MVCKGCIDVQRLHWSLHRGAAMRSEASARMSTYDADVFIPSKPLPSE